MKRKKISFRPDDRLLEKLEALQKEKNIGITEAIQKLFSRDEKLEQEIKLLKETPKATEQGTQETPVHDLEHLNIDQKDGAIQIYISESEARLEREKIEREKRTKHAKEKATERYWVELAVQKAKAEGEAVRAKIKEESANRIRFGKQYVRSGKSTVDWGNSVGVEPDYSDGYR